MSYDRKTRDRLFIHDQAPEDTFSFHIIMVNQTKRKNKENTSINSRSMMSRGMLTIMAFIVRFSFSPLPVF